MTDFDFRHKFKSIKKAAYLDLRGVEIEIEADTDSSTGGVLFLAEPADQAIRLIEEYQAGATVTARALLDSYVRMIKRVRAVQQSARLILTTKHQAGA